MGIFASASDAISSTFNVITDSAEAVGKSVQTGTKMIDRRATKLDLTDKATVQVDTAKAMLKIKRELDADEKLAAMYAELETEFA
jgi:hypothetical protein